MVTKFEKQFTERAVKKPTGGVSILPERKREAHDLSVREAALKQQLRFKG